MTKKHWLSQNVVSVIEVVAKRSATVVILKVTILVTIKLSLVHPKPPYDQNCRWPFSSLGDQFSTSHRPLGSLVTIWSPVVTTFCVTGSWPAHHHSDWSKTVHSLWIWFRSLVFTDNTTGTCLFYLSEYKLYNNLYTVTSSQDLVAIHQHQILSNYIERVCSIIYIHILYTVYYNTCIYFCCYTKGYTIAIYRLMN